MACLKPGDVVLDSMAGIGSIPIEAANRASTSLKSQSCGAMVHALAGDIDENLVMNARRNAEAFYQHHGMQQYHGLSQHFCLKTKFESVYVFGRF